jgi:hypothetical protein
MIVRQGVTGASLVWQVCFSCIDGRKTCLSSSVKLAHHGPADRGLAKNISLIE